MSEGTIICQNCWREQSFHGQDTCEYCNRSMVADATLLETLRNIQLESTPTHAQSGEQRLEFTPTSKLILKVKKVDKPLIYQFTSDRAILGRRDAKQQQTPDIDLYLFAAQVLGVSRQHAILHLHNNGLYLEDLNSANGTFLNGKRLSPNDTDNRVASGDLVQLGNLLFTLNF